MVEERIDMMTHPDPTLAAALRRPLMAIGLACALCAPGLAQVVTNPQPVPGVPPAPAPVAAVEFVPLTLGPVNGPLELRVVDGRSGWELGGPRRFADFQLLGIEFCGRNELDSTLPGRARRRLDMDTNRSWIELPWDMGTLHRYRRRVGADVRYGFMRIAPTGVPRLLLERTSPTGAEVFEDKVAVSLDGKSLLVATRPSAGGDLFLVPVAGGIPRELTASVGPKQWSPDGLWLGGDWGFAIESGGVWRFDLDGDAFQVPVASTGPLSWTGQAVMDDRRRFGLATASEAGFGDRAFVFSRTDAARPADVAPGTSIRPAGFQPEHSGGPWMAVNSDGTLAAWTETLPPPTPGANPIRDVRIARIGPGSATALVTGDALLIDTLTEIARIHFVAPSDLVYAAGEPNDPTEGGVESADLFRARLDPAGHAQVVNVSLTSGATAPPFAGTPLLTPAAAYRLASGVLLMHDNEAATLLTLDLQTGMTRLLDSNVKELLWLEPTGSSFAAAVRRDVQPRPHDLLNVDPLTQSVTTIQFGGPATRFLSATTRGDWFAWRRQDLPGLTTLHRSHLSSPAVATMPGPAAAIAAPLRLTRTGDLAFTHGLSSTQSWQQSGALVTLGPGLVLP